MAARETQAHASRGRSPGCSSSGVQYPVVNDVALDQAIEKAAEREIRAKEDSEVNSDAHDTDPLRDHTDQQPVEPRVIDEIEVEDLAVDGICGVY
jgi:mycofactocin precursor